MRRITSILRTELRSETFPTATEYIIRSSVDVDLLGRGRHSRNEFRLYCDRQPNSALRTGPWPRLGQWPKGLRFCYRALDCRVREKRLVSGARWACVVKFNAETSCLSAAIR